MHTLQADDTRLFRVHASPVKWWSPTRLCSFCKRIEAVRLFFPFLHFFPARQVLRCLAKVLPKLFISCKICRLMNLARILKFTWKASENRPLASHSISSRISKDCIVIYFPSIHFNGSLEQKGRSFSTSFLFSSLTQNQTCHRHCVKNLSPFEQKKKSWAILQENRTLQPSIS